MGRAGLIRRRPEKVPLLDRNWRKSTYSSTNGSCVEVRRLSHVIEVRDTKDRNGPVLSFSTESWHNFVRSVHKGEFDL
jgi:Domain of unknown function (DUF397)